MAVEDGANESAESASKRRSRLRMGAILATVATLIGIATGVLTLRDQLSSNDGPSPPPGPKREVPRFEGVAGHLAESRAILTFLKDNDEKAVYLEVGFPKHGGDNVISETVPVKTGDRLLVKEVTLVTECTPAPPPNGEPTPADGCTGTSLSIAGPETGDSQTYFEHGVPVIKGYFAVDVTGALHMGVTPIILKPLTFEQAKSRSA